MVDRFHKLASGWTCPAPIRRGVGILLLLGLGASLAPAAPYVYAPKAHFTGIDRAFVGPGSVAPPGAGVHAFRDPESDNRGTERFVVRWYANPPGIPPGVVVLLESIQERSPVIKNHVLRINEKSEGHIRSVIEIPAKEVQLAGRVLKWRVRVVWRGRLLASQTSDNWEG